MKLGRAVLVAVLLCSLAEASWADKKTETEARTYYDQGTKYYALGPFEEAIQNYEKAFELRPDPVLLYNIAQAYRLQGNFQQASFFYKSYLRNQPDAKNRAEVEARLADLEEQLDKQRKTSNAPPIGPVNPPNRGGTGPAEPDADTDGDADADADADADGDGGATRIPPPDQAAALGDDGAGATTSAAPHDSGGKRPIYKKWWFWGGIGAVAVGAVVIIAVASGGDAGAPDSPLGDYRLP